MLKQHATKVKVNNVLPPTIHSYISQGNENENRQRFHDDLLFLVPELQLRWRTIEKRESNRYRTYNTPFFYANSKIEFALYNVGQNYIHHHQCSMD